MEVTRTNAGSSNSASSHGIVHITADNGYILYVNGERIGAGGAALAMAAGSSSKAQDWRHTDAWAFQDSCDTPTVRADLGRLSSLSSFPCKSVLYGTFV